MEEARERGTEHLRTVEEQRWPQFEKIIEDDNRQWKEELLPLYRQMTDLFTAKMQFAESSTRQHFGELIEFTELWNRWLRGTLPGELLDKVGPNEEKLAALYTDLEITFERLQAALKA